MKKLPKIYENGENLVKTINMAKDALRNGLGPAHNSDKAFVAIPGDIIEDVYFVIIAEKDENGSKPIDWYAWAPKSNFPSGFGGWYKYEDHDEFIKANPWIKDEWDSLKK